MKRNIYVLCFMFFFIKDISSTRTGTSLLQYDITKALDRWFSKVLNFDTLSAIQEVINTFEEAEKYNISDFEYDLEHEVKPFPTRIIFHDVVYRMVHHLWIRPLSFSEIDWNLRTNEVVFSGENGSWVCVGITGHVRASNDEPTQNFKVDLDFQKFELRAIASSNSNISADISYDYFYANRFSAYGAKWWRNDTLRSIAKETLIKELEPAFIAMLKEIVNRHNTQFRSAFEPIYSISKQAKQDVISTNSDIFQKGRKYYYLIPNFPFCCGFALKTVVIKGLSNIESLKFYRYPKPFSHALLMDNVHGSMVLDYERVEEKPLRLDFKIDHISMSIVHANNCVIVEAPEFSVSSTSGPLTHQQSVVLVQLIESAIVSSLMPSRQICDVPKDAIVPVAIKLRITEASDDWNKIKEICQDWIPFNKKNI